MIRAIAAALVVLAAAGIAAATTTPSFGPATTIARLRSSGFLDEIAVADLTGDRRPDIVGVKVAPADETRPIVILAGNREGGFQDLTARLFSGEVPQTQNPSPIVLADFNRDGAPDLVLAGERGTPNVVLLNDGRGHFAPSTGPMPAKPFSPDGNGLAVAPIEVNGDHHVDLLIAFTKPNYVGRWIQVLVN